MTLYPAYKPTNIEWIGDIPKHWEVKKLKYLAKILNGQDHKNVWDDNGEYPIMGTGGEFGRAKEYLHTGPSVLLGRKGTIDKPQFITNPFWSVDTAYYTDIFPTTNPKYFFYCCTTIRFELYKYGSAVPSMTQETLNQIFFATPPLTEQTVIADYLDKKTADIDGLIAKKQQLIALLREERTAVINHAVTKGINPNAPLKASNIEWLGEIPQHWEVKKLKYVAVKIQTGSTPPSNEEKYYNEELNWFTPSDFSDNLSLENSKRKISTSAIDEGVVKLFPPNSVLMVGIGATLGKTGYISQPASSNQQINSISFDNENLAKFYAYFFYSNQLNIVALANAATLAILNQSQTKDIPLPLPSSKEEIIAIVEHIETQKIDTAIEKIEKEITLLQEYRTALISEVVTGKINVI